jgi:hypothetical protein
MANSNGELKSQDDHRLQKLASRTQILKDGMVMRFVGFKGKPWEEETKYWRLWVPKALIPGVLSEFHSKLTAGHLGVRKTYLRLESRVYWFGIRRDVCQVLYQLPTVKESSNSGCSFKPESPWELVSVDLMGPYPKGHFQSQYLFVVVDMLSKHVEMFPLRQATSDIVIAKLWEVFCRWGVPKVILSDNGSQFVSKLYEKFCEGLGINTFHIAVYHAQANNTERYN